MSNLLIDIREDKVEDNQSLDEIISTQYGKDKKTPFDFLVTIKQFNLVKGFINCTVRMVKHKNTEVIHYDSPVGSHLLFLKYQL